MNGRPRSQALARRTMLAMLAVVVMLPVALIGRAWSLALVPCLACAAIALRSALQLRSLSRSQLDGDGAAGNGRPTR